MNDDPLFTTRQVARFYGVEMKTIQRWVRDGRLRAIRTPGGRMRIRGSEVRRLVEADRSRNADC